MYQAKTIYTQLALETIVAYLKNEKPDATAYEPLPPKLQKKRACFVTLHKKNGALRGCIGTIRPATENLYQEIRRNAVSAAANDPRFEPLSPNELDEITLSVDVLSLPENVEALDELDPKKYGVIVSDGGFNRAVLLPDLDGIETVAQQLDIAKRKAGIYEPGYGNLEIQRFSVERFH